MSYVIWYKPDGTVKTYKPKGYWAERIFYVLSAIFGGLVGWFLF